jgi:hypothetical protein
MAASSEKKMRHSLCAFLRLRRNEHSSDIDRVVCGGGVGYHCFALMLRGKSSLYLQASALGWKLLGSQGLYRTSGCGPACRVYAGLELDRGYLFRQSVDLAVSKASSCKKCLLKRLILTIVLLRF